MSLPDLDRGRRLLDAIKQELDDSETSVEDRLGWANDDLHELFDCWGFAKQWLWDGYFLRIHPDEPDLNMTVPPCERLDPDVLAHAVELVEQLKRQRGIPV